MRNDDKIEKEIKKKNEWMKKQQTLIVSMCGLESSERRWSREMKSKCSNNKMRVCVCV